VGFALAILIPTTYETFLVNRLRYIWPFAPAWFVGLAALAEVSGTAIERVLAAFSAPVSHLAVLVSGAFVGLLGSRIGPSIEDLASSCAAITAQQVALGRWAKDELPEQARLGINDTGAIAYFGGHSTFDIVGLTTAGEARFWSAGFGSRFEHYEKLPREALPTHWIVYPEWFGIPSLLGTALESRSVRHTILGGYTMTAFEARYDVLGTGERPLDAKYRARHLEDVLDVADLDDEKSHGYVLYETTDVEDVVVADDRLADGGRVARSRDTFTLKVRPGGVLLARWGATEPTAVTVSLDGKVVAEPQIAVTGWDEVPIAVPAGVSGSVHVEVDTKAGKFASLHYWSYD
jgi:hypothetical protein